MSPKAKNDEAKAVAPKPKAEEKDVADKEEQAPEMPEFKVSAFIAPGALTIDHTRSGVPHNFNRVATQKALAQQ
jgi:hypothetical protein